MADSKEAGKHRPDEHGEEKQTEGSSKKQKLEIPPGINNGEHLYGFQTAELEEDEDDDEEDYNAEEDDADEDGLGHSEEEEEVVDRKGKGIMINEKGKGKLVVDSDSSDDSDSSFSEGLDVEEDDLLEEIDLDNILPSRTRNRRAQPGLRIPGNCDDKDTGA